MLKEGLTYRVECVVEKHDTAMEVGSGDLPVLATPRMMALMENAAMRAVADFLPEGSTTVGGHIESSHLKPTPVGEKVVAEAVLTKVDGRKLYFDIVALQNGEVIGEGKHLRFVVDRERFLQKLK